MTYDEFLAKLRETPREWRFDGIGCLRYRQCCPITAIDRRHLHANHAVNVAQELGLRKGIAQRVIGAADMFGGYSKAVRADLLDACGLKEWR